MQRKDLTKPNLPDAPGVYVFRDSRGKPLYVGKAGSLRDRVRSYFSTDLGRSRAPAIVAMVEVAKRLTFTQTDSVLEALILEANLIKKWQPRFNVDEKDNKSWNYLVITKEEYPRVLIVRGRELFGLQTKKYKLKTIFGPYTSGASLKEALKIVRKILPFRDKCIPNSGKSCFNAQIGLCPGVCAGTMGKREYTVAVRHITLLFSGKIGALRRTLEREMRAHVEREEFEKAAHTKRQLSALAHIRDVSLIKDEYRVASGGSFRIEGYDIAHLSGTETVGVMTVVEGGEPMKSGYRKFNVRGAGNNDVAALREVLTRRLAHTEWPMPRIIVVDGGKQQLNAAARVLKDAGVEIPLVSVVKDEHHRPGGFLGDKKLTELHERTILQVNNEAHRFAVASHRKRRRL